MRQLLIGVTLSLLVALPGNTSFAQSARSTVVTVKVSTFLAIGSVPETIIIVSDPTKSKSYLKAVTFPVYTNVPANISMPPTGSLTRQGGTETIPASFFLQPEEIAPPGTETALEATVVLISGLRTRAGTYEGKVLITLTAQP